MPGETHENPEQNGRAPAIDDHLRLTLAPWRIQGQEKALARTGHLDQYAYGSVTGREAADEQLGIVLTPTSGALVVDVDDAVFDDTELGAYLADHQPISTRGALGGLPNRHYLVDMRAFYARGRLVRQGPITGGDVKANGFVPAPGSRHPSGDRYEPVATMGGVVPVIACDEELYGLLVAARTAAPRRTGADGAAMAPGGELAATEHYLKHGLPGGAHDDALTRLAMRLVVQGMTDGAALGVLREVIARTAVDERRGGWTDENLLRKIASAREVSGAEPVSVPPGWLRAAETAVAAVQGDQAGDVRDAVPVPVPVPVVVVAVPVAAAPEDEPPVDWTAPDALGSPDEPMVGARALEAALHTGREKLLTRRYWRGSFHAWSGACWREIPDADVNAELYTIAEHARFASTSAKGVTSFKPWAPTTPKITNLRNALAACLNTSDTVEMPAWLDGRTGADAVRLVACSNVLVDPLTGASRAHTAAYLNGHALDFAYDPQARCPAWRGFLESVWPGDADSRTLLAQWFGYVLSGRTDLQKLMYLKGMPRSGKGTIARILTALLGAQSVCGPTFDSFGGGFGLELLVKAQMAVVGDARFSGDPRVMQAAISKILSITGEDKLNVDRKYKTAWSGTLPTRLMLLSNEMPWFRDSSSAIVDRMLLLVFKESFVGREDHTLELRLRAELAGIFNWALEGYRELVIADGRFVRPAASAEVLDEFRESVSPIAAWLEAECAHGGEGDLLVSGALYQRWCAWCEENGHKPGGANGFLRLVQTVWPTVSRYPNLVVDAEGKRMKAWSGLRYTGPEG